MRTRLSNSHPLRQSGYEASLAATINKSHGAQQDSSARIANYIGKEYAYQKVKSSVVRTLYTQRAC